MHIHAKAINLSSESQRGLQCLPVCTGISVWRNTRPLVSASATKTHMTRETRSAHSHVYTTHVTHVTTSHRHPAEACQEGQPAPFGVPSTASTLVLPTAHFTLSGSQGQHGASRSQPGVRGAAEIQAPTPRLSSVQGACRVA